MTDRLIGLAGAILECLMVGMCAAVAAYDLIAPIFTHPGC